MRFLQASRLTVAGMKRSVAMNYFGASRVPNDFMKERPTGPYGLLYSSLVIKAIGES